VKVTALSRVAVLVLATGLISSPSLDAADSQDTESAKAYGALDSHAIYAEPNPDAEVIKGFNFNLKTVTIKKSHPGTDYILNGSYGSTPSFTGGLQDSASGKKRVWLTVHNLDEGICALVPCKVKSLATDWKTTLIKGESITSKNEYLTHTDFYSEDISWSIDDEVKWLTVLSPEGDSSLLTVVVKIGSADWRHFITVRYAAIYPAGLSGGYSSINEPGVNNPFTSRSVVFRPTLMETFSGRSAEFGRLYLLGPTGKNRHSYVVRGSELLASVGIEPQLEGKSEYRLNLGALTEPIDYSGGKNLAESIVDSLSTTAKSYRQSVRDEAKKLAIQQEGGKRRAALAGVPYVTEKEGAIAINFVWESPQVEGMTWLYRELKVSKSGDASYFSIIGNWTPPFYLGVQEIHNPVTGEIKKNAIFSAWDTYEGNDCSTCGPESRPSNGRTTVVDLGKGVTGGNGFGYEGTGVNAFINDFGWKVGDTIRAVVNLRPVTGGSEISAALQLNDQEWRYFGTYKFSKIFKNLEPGFSFIEDFGRTPWIVRSATFGNTWLENDDQTSTVIIDKLSARANLGLNTPYHKIMQKEPWGLWAQIGGDEFISTRDSIRGNLNTSRESLIPIEARQTALNIAGDAKLAYLERITQARKLKEAAVAKTAAEKLAADLKAKQDSDAKAAADKAALLKSQADLAAANASLAEAQKVNRDLGAQLTAIEGQFLVLSDSISTIQTQVLALNTKLSTTLKSLSTANAKIKKICAAKPKPKGC
jgi:hypothetical protein